MGLSFHYKGSIRNYSRITELTEEVKDICNSLHWKYHLWGKEITTDNPVIAKTKNSNYTPEDIRGISVSPDECEPLFLTFLPNGTLCSPIKLMYYDLETNDLMIEVIHTKTQFAGPDTHIALMKLLLYLKNKYFSEFEVDDEGLYWETQDKKVLHAQFAKYNYLLEVVTQALSDFKAKPGETATSLAERLEELLLNKFSQDK